MYKTNHTSIEHRLYHREVSGAYTPNQRNCTNTFALYGATGETKKQHVPPAQQQKTPKEKEDLSQDIAKAQELSDFLDDALVNDITEDLENDPANEYTLDEDGE